MVFVLLGAHGVLLSQENTELWDQLLTQYVNNGYVDYQNWSKQTEALESYMRYLSQVSMDEFNHWSDQDQIAFLINAYNAITIQFILEYYPVKSIKDIPGVWDKKVFFLLGQERTLNEIEHQMLRKNYSEPRIHFAVVCASISCPKLQNYAFVGSHLDSQLNQAMNDFLRDSNKNFFNFKEKKIKLSKIFKWFQSDFEQSDVDPNIKKLYKKEAPLVQFLSNNMPKKYQYLISNQKLKIDYLSYDWGLNQK